ncbi:hypothetical protein GCM10010222_17190 [Streptomyces tanashiensis]|nr:hypothetical protein GCM10010222_17190 [Streptomyces tanashiensis]
MGARQGRVSAGVAVMGRDRMGQVGGCTDTHTGSTCRREPVGRSKAREREVPVLPFGTRSRVLDRSALAYRAMPALLMRGHP